MKKSTYEQLVEIVCNNGISPPKALFKYNNPWPNYTMLARFLIQLREGVSLSQDEVYQYAVDLLEEAIAAAPKIDTSKDYLHALQDENIDINGLDQLIWAHHDLSHLYFLSENMPKAFREIDCAIQLAESTDWLFDFMIRGKIVYTKLNMLYNSGQKDFAENLVDRYINQHEKVNVINNSYLYFGYRFKARIDLYDDKFESAKSFLLKSLDAVDATNEYVIKSREELEKLDLASQPPNYARDLKLKFYDENSTQKENIISYITRVLPSENFQLFEWDVSQETLKKRDELIEQIKNPMKEP